MLDLTLEHLRHDSAPHEGRNANTTGDTEPVFPGSEHWGEGPGACADVANAVARWLAYLGGERRYAENTLEAYERDGRQFLAFLSAFRGCAVSLALLDTLTAQ